MINKYLNQIEMQCLCGETSDTYPDDEFHDMIKDCKEKGWVIWRDTNTGEWVHRCPTCTKNRAEIFGTRKRK